MKDLIESSKNIILKHFTDNQKVVVSDEMIDKMGKELNFLFLTLLQNSCKFATIEHRNTLKTFDIKLAMKTMRIPPLIVISKNSIIEDYSKTNGENLLNSESFEQTINVEKPRPVLLKAHWLAIDGIQPLIPENPANVFRLKLKSPASSQDPLSSVKKFKSVSNTNAQNDEENSKCELSKEQTAYLDAVFSIFESDDSQKKKKVMTSLRTDSHIETLIPIIVARVSKKVSEEYRCFGTLSKAIDLLSCLAASENKNMIDNVKNKILDKIIALLLFCCLKPKICENEYAEFTIREEAAAALCLLCSKFPSLNLGPKLAKSVFSKLLLHKKHKSPLSSIYGCLCVLHLLGFTFSKKFIFGAFFRFTTEMYKIAYLNESKVSRECSVRVLWLLVCSVRNFIDYSGELSQRELSILNLYRELFGENLVFESSELREFFL